MKPYFAAAPGAHVDAFVAEAQRASCVELIESPQAGVDGGASLVEQRILADDTRRCPFEPDAMERFHVAEKLQGARRQRAAQEAV